MAGDAADAWDAARVRAWLDSRIAAARAEQAVAVRAGRSGEGDCDKASAEEMACSLLHRDRTIATRDTFAAGIAALLGRDDYGWRGVNDDDRFDRHVRAYLKKLARMTRTNTGFDSTGRYQ